MAALTHPDLPTLRRDLEALLHDCQTDAARATGAHRYDAASAARTMAGRVGFMLVELEMAAGGIGHKADLVTTIARVKADLVSIRGAVRSAA